METSAILAADVCKDRLDLFRIRSGERSKERSFANDEKGIRSLFEWAGPIDVLGMESTGGYERALALAGLERGVTVRVENPRRVRDFARATGRLNKTDRADAKVIAEFLSKVEGRPWFLADASTRELDGLTLHRRALLEERTRLGNRLEHREALPGMALRHIQDRLQMLKKEIQEVEEARRRLVENDSELKRDYEAILKLKGVGETTAMLVLARARNVEDYDSAQSYAAAAGLAPGRRESGKWKGKTRISKQGDAILRAGIYFAGSVASRYDPTLKEFKQRLLARGKNKMQTLIACMRKLLMRIYGILKALRQGKTPYYGDQPNQRP